MLLVVGLLAGAARAPAQAQAPRRDPLPPAMGAALAEAGVAPEAFVGLAWPLRDRAPRWEHDADRPVQPGSTMKVLTTIVALDRLGPNLRGRTELLSDAPLDNGVLRGDLVLRGGADPELGWPQLWQLFDELRERGVREIEGDLLLDRSRYRPARIDLGLPPFDDAPAFPYNVIPDALMLTGNLMSLELSSAGDALQARTLPRLDGVELRAEGMALGEGRCGAWSAGWAEPQVQDEGSRLVIALRGQFPRDCTTRAWLQLVDRDRLAAFTLRTLWTRLGGTLRGQVREGLAPAGARVLATRLARPWGELLRPLNKQSDNVLSRQLFLELGVPAMAHEPQRTTLELAAREMQAWLEAQGIDSRGFVADNGSGLSRVERLSARQLARAMRVALAGPHAPDLLMGLPTVGVDGTMRNRLKDSPAAGWARLKTGTLRNVAALAGIVHDARREPWILVAIVNDEQAARTRRALDALADAIARGDPLWPPQAAREP